MSPDNNEKLEGVEVKVTETEESIEAEVIGDEITEEDVAKEGNEAPVDEDGNILIDEETFEESSEAKAVKTERIAAIKGQVEELLAEYNELTALGGGSALINGFRNKTVILPLAIQQNRIDKFEKIVTKNLKMQVQNTQQQFQYMYSGISKNAEANNLMSLSVEAIMRLLDVDQKDIEVEIKKIELEREADKEAESDAKLNRKIVKRAAKQKDIVKIFFKGTIDGKEFPGGACKPEGFHLTLGNKQFIPGFEEQLVGAEAGQKLDVKVTFPENYGNEDLAGKEAVFATEVLAVKEIVPVEEKKKTPEASQG